MAIGNNNEKYYAPTADYQTSYSPTTYASNSYTDGAGYWNGDYYNPEQNVTPTAGSQSNFESAVGELLAEREGGRGDPNAPSGKATQRNADNNYGYASFGLAGDIASGLGKVVGGPVGMVLGAPGKLAGIDNLSAVQAARKDLGLTTTEVGAKQVAGSMVKGTKATVGQVQIGQATYNVSLDPKEVGKINKQGIATISPPQAKQIAAENQTAITEAPKTEEAPKEKGPVGKALAKARETLTGVKTEAPSAKTSTPSTLGGIQTVGATPGPGYNPANKTQLDSTRTAPTAPGYAEGFGPLGAMNANLGPNRPNMPSSQITDTIRDTVAATLGPGYSVSITSGTPDEGKQYGSFRHTTKMAADFGITDPNGKKVTDNQKLGQVALGLAEKGVTGIGFGKGYMGGQAIHADIAAPGAPAAWGAGESYKGMVKNDPELYDAIQAQFADTKAVTKNFKETMEQTTAPSPTSRSLGLGLAKDAGLTGPDTISRNMYDTQMGISTPSTMEVSRNMYDTNVSPTMAAAEALNAPDIGKVAQGLAAMNAGYTPGTSMSPANFSTVGMGYQYSPDQIGSMSYAIAGELGPQALKGLALGQPEAINEAAAIMGTIDNRVQAIANVGYKDPLGQALTAYDSVNKGFATKNTATNYAQYGQTVQDTVKGLLDGSITSQNTAQQTTHYANMDVASPSWGKTPSFAATQTTVGAHTFGTPDKTMTPAKDAYGTAYGPNAATSVAGVSGMSHTPGAMYGGATNTAGTPGGMTASSTNALGGGLGLGGGYVDSGANANTAGSTAPADGKKGNESTNSGLGGTSSSANGNSAGSQSGASGSSSSGNGNSGGSGRGGNDGAGSSGSGAGGAGGSSGAGGTGAGGRGSDRDGDGRGR